MSARGRMISATLGSSHKFSSVTNDAHRLMYVLMLVNADVEGRLEADPRILNGRVFTLLGWEANEVERGLRALAAARLIDLYEVDGAPYAVISDFHKHNTVRKDREGASRIPAPPDRRREDSGRTPGGSTADSGLKQINSIQVNPNTTPPTPPQPKPEPEPPTEDDEEADRSIDRADRKTATNYAPSLLAQQHPSTRSSLDDMQSVYAWKRGQFKVIATRLLDLARTHGDERVAGAVNHMLGSGATISNPMAYVTKILSETPKVEPPAKPKHDLDAIFSYDGRPVN